ncbi:protein antagonist of like heterochromatin protein 1 [Plakobranchus ocellatus]|uniref:Protein antagonist of like heterochromatin protein 1 n=1 Tax=Plakobranchus ocellatus TaxID=259542 RepID=A0AAV4AF41_9GAST|nr:protein antagonist of like heterochromatin protein 1 [Plakobranchus ocellatus]
MYSTPLSFLFCLKVPDTEGKWLAVASGYAKHGQFPNCVGALDGKHFVIQAPANSGSDFFNYKGFHSIILLALVDSNYKFIFIDVGRNGRCGDAGVFQDSSLFQGFEKKLLHIPTPQPLPGKEHPLPMVMVGDDAFPLKPYLLKPYPEHNNDHKDEKRIFNYRLSRARRCSENAFGLLTKRFRLFNTKMLLAPEKATAVVKCCVALHNYLISERDRTYMNNLYEHESYTLPTMQNQAGNRHTQEAIRVRDEFRDYFCTIGQVPWQANMS